MTNSQLYKLSAQIPDHPPNNLKDVFKPTHVACRPNAVCFLSATKKKKKEKRKKYWRLRPKRRDRGGRGTKKRKVVSNSTAALAKSCWMMSEKLKYTFNVVMRLRGQQLLLIGTLKLSHCECDVSKC